MARVAGDVVLAFLVNIWVHSALTFSTLLNDYGKGAEKYKDSDLSRLLRVLKCGLSEGVISSGEFILITINQTTAVH